MSRAVANGRKRALETMAANRPRALLITFELGVRVESNNLSLSYPTTAPHLFSSLPPTHLYRHLSFCSFSGTPADGHETVHQAVVVQSCTAWTRTGGR